MVRGDSYFHWLQKKSGLSGPLASMLADTEFVSVDGLDNILKKKAKEDLRHEYAEEIAERDELDDKDAETIYKSVRGDTCLFEVILCLASAVKEMFEEEDIAHFFGIILKNVGLDVYDEEDLDLHPDAVREYWEKRIRIIVNREYSDTGNGGLFPLKNLELWSDNTKEFIDRRTISLWQQMIDWVDLHNNEDGEWVD